MSARRVGRRLQDVGCVGVWGEMRPHRLAQQRAAARGWGHAAAVVALRQRAASLTSQRGTSEVLVGELHTLDVLLRTHIRHVATQVTIRSLPTV